MRAVEGSVDSGGFGGRLGGGREGGTLQRQASGGLGSYSAVSPLDTSQTSVRDRVWSKRGRALNYLHVQSGHDEVCTLTACTGGVP